MAYMRVYAYACARVCVYECVRVCMHVYVCAHLRAIRGFCRWGRRRPFMLVGAIMTCLGMFVFPYPVQIATLLGVSGNVHISRNHYNKHTGAQLHTDTDTYTHTHTDTPQTHTHIHTYTQTHRHTDTYTDTQTQAQTHTDTHKDTDTQTQTHTHTQDTLHSPTSLTHFTFPNFLI
jgi:ABC-type transport system involved in cytochrome bd biosynthesis fused ATPase/permease subunit